MNLNGALHCISTIIQTDTCRFSSQGTGFYYSRLAPGEGEGPQWRTIEDMWLVTNRHILIPSQGNEAFAPTKITLGLRKIDDSGALHWEQVVLSGDGIEELARFHPDSSIDVAVLEISEAVINRIRSGAKYIQPYFLHAGNFAGKNNIQVEASSDVLVVGYPKGFYDNVNLFPIIKSGIVASRWELASRASRIFLLMPSCFPGLRGA